MKKAIAYIRVSTQEQADKGYSVDGQAKELIPAVEADGYEVVATITDAGYSRDTLDRPGIDEMLDLVVTGDIDAVWAWKRDRYGASPNPEILAAQLSDYGTDLRALDDSGTGDDADFVNGIKDLIAKRELKTIVARSRMGRLQKARDGKIIGAGLANYGFKYNADKDGYEIDEETMPIVHRIFTLLADGHSLNGVVQMLNRENVKPPNAQYWNITFMTGVVSNDVYKPHAVEDLTNITKAVRNTLDPDKQYGIWYYNRYRTKTIKKTVDDGMGGKKQKRRHKKTELPRSDWIAVPVPDAGIPLETVLAARNNIANNIRPSNAGARFWELSGGIIFCGDCGRAMRSQNVKKKSGKMYHYYACAYPYSQPGTCDNKKMYRAEGLEPRVAGLVSDILSNEKRLLSEIDALITQENARLQNPRIEMKVWIERLAEVERKRDKYQEMYAADAMTIDELKTKLSQLTEQRTECENGLREAEGFTERLAELKRDRARLQEMYRQRALERGLSEFSAEQRHNVYTRLKLHVYAHKDQSIGIEGELPLSVSYFEGPLMTDIEVYEDGFSAFVYQNKSDRTATLENTNRYRFNLVDGV